MHTRGPLSYQDVINRKKCLSRYSMFVTTIDQDHKNLSFFWPNDPLGRANFAFECHLAPSSVTVYGDRIQTVTFQSQAQFCPEDQPPLNISPEWMWTCTALRHAAKMYVRHNNSLTKQEKRELRRPRK